MLYGILAAIGFAGGVLVDKFELSKRRISIPTYIPMFFLLIAFFMAIIQLVSRVPLFPAQAFNPSYIIAFLLMVALAVAWNIFYYRSLAKESVQEFDLILLTEPLITIALASFFFSSERHFTVLLAGLFAALVLVITHMHRRKVRFNAYAKELMVAIVLMSLEVLVIKELLVIYHPISLYFLRTVCIAVVTAWIYKPKLNRIKTLDIVAMSGTALFGILQMVSRFYGYANGGVVLTTIVLLLGPVLVEISSVTILKEKITLKTSLAFVLIILCIVYANIASAAGGHI